MKFVLYNRTNLNTKIVILFRRNDTKDKQEMLLTRCASCVELPIEQQNYMRPEATFSCNTRNTIFPLSLSNFSSLKCRFLLQEDNWFCSWLLKSACVRYSQLPYHYESYRMLWSMRSFTFKTAATFLLLSRSTFVSN